MWRRSLRSCRPYAAAATAYAAIALAWTYPLIAHATSHVAIWDVLTTGSLGPNDLMGVIAAGSRNASALLEGDLGRLLNQGLCYPTPMSGTLGEHLIELGILTVPGQMLSRNPILAYNLASLLLLLIAGLSMLALIRYWTASPAAAFVAGLLFAFHPSRLDNLGHPHVIGNHWLPLVLLLFERTLAGGRLRHALLLGLVTALQCLVGAYPLAALAIFVPPFAVVRLVQERRVLDRRRIMLLVLAGLIAVIPTAVVLGSYGKAAGLWGVLQRRQLQLVPYASLLPGAPYAVGATVLVLAAVLLFVRSKRSSPVPAVVLATVVCIAVCADGQLWPGGPSFQGFYPWLADRVRILGVARVPGAVRSAVYFGFAVLAGLGLARVLEIRHVGPRARAALAAAVSAVILVEVFHPSIAPLVYYFSNTVTLVEYAPTPDVVAAYDVFDRRPYDGAILDIPYSGSNRSIVYEMPPYAFLTAYHHRPAAACFNSFYPPSFFNVARMVSRLPTARGVEELAASGLRNLVWRHSYLDPVGMRKVALLRRMPGVEVLRNSAAVTSFRINVSVATHSDTSQLRATGVFARTDDFQNRTRHLLDLEVENLAYTTWVLPHPVRPLVARVRWLRREDCEPGPWTEARVMLPLALGARRRDLVPLVVGEPPAGAEAEIEVPELGWTARAAGGCS